MRSGRFGQADEVLLGQPLTAQALRLRQAREGMRSRSRLSSSLSTQKHAFGLPSVVAVASRETFSLPLSRHDTGIMIELCRALV